MQLPHLSIFRNLWPRRPAPQPPKEPTVENKEQPFIYTDEQLMARLKFFIGICLALTLTGIVFVVLYSIIFVTQPLNAISPIDQKFFELIIPIATFLTGTLSGIMLSGQKKEDQDAMLAAQKQAAANQNSAATNAAATNTSTSTLGGSSNGFAASSGLSSTSGFGSTTTNSWGSTSLGGTSASAWGSSPGSTTATSSFGSTPSADAGVSTGWGGKAAPPPVTQWPEK